MNEILAKIKQLQEKLQKSQKTETIRIKIERLKKAIHERNK